MQWRGPIKQRNIDAPEDLYKEFKAEAARRGMRVYTAFAEAMDQWIFGNKGERSEKPGSPLANLTADERSVAIGAVMVLRSGNEHVVEILRTVIHNYNNGENDKYRHKKLGA
jgi:hypothetical protein